MMEYKRLTVIALILCLISSAALAADRPLVDLGRWNESDLAQIITAAWRIEAPGERIVTLSRHFLETPYAADTLIGGPQQAEQLVVNLAGFDCFTLLDTVEALRRAADPADLQEQLRQVRYRGGQVAYAKRRHFFSDWVAGEAGMIADVTAAVGQARTRVVVKQLNLKNDGSHWLPGIPVARREISYIPGDTIDRELLSSLQAGDYLGIYSEQAGLDVSHTGLLVKAEDGVMLRHASSRSSVRRVVDEDLLTYLQGKPGLVVYRVRARDD
jgi:hypothetical protein